MVRWLDGYMVKWLNLNISKTTQTIQSFYH